MRRFALALSLLVAGSLHAHPGSAIAVAADGVIYFVDTGGGVFAIDARGTMTRVPGPAFHWFALDPTNRFANTRFPSIPGAEFQAVGNPTLILSSDFPVVITTDGSFHYAEWSEAGRVRIVRITPDGRVSTRATLPPGPKGLNRRG
jgi:hypothetical protein